MGTGTVPKRTIKDSVFTSLFGKPKYALELYFALYPEMKTKENITEAEVKIITLQNVLTDSIYNDLGFMVRDKLIILVEAQSTWSVNIVFRMMLYLAQTYKEYVDQERMNMYSTKKLKLPKPELFV